MAKRLTPPTRELSKSEHLPTRALESVRAAQGMSSLIKRAQILATLDKSIRSRLPPEVAANSRLLNFDENRVVFSVSSPVWKTQLRMHTQSITRTCSELGLPNRTLYIKVSAPEPEIKSTRPRPLSSAARESLRATAQSLSDSELRDQILKLASVRED